MSTSTARSPSGPSWRRTPLLSAAINPSAEKIQTCPGGRLIEWQAHKLSGQDPLAVRVSKTLRNDELLLTAFAGTRLKMELDRVPLWRGNHVTVKQLAEDF